MAFFRWDTRALASSIVCEAVKWAVAKWGVRASRRVMAGFIFDETIIMSIWMFECRRHFTPPPVSPLARNPVTRSIMSPVFLHFRSSNHEYQSDVLWSGAGTSCLITVFPFVFGCGHTSHQRLLIWKMFCGRKTLYLMHTCPSHNRTILCKSEPNSFSICWMKWCIKPIVDMEVRAYAVYKYMYNVDCSPCAGMCGICLLPVNL